MRARSYLIPLTAIATVAFATQASAQSMIREQKVISSAGARHGGRLHGLMRTQSRDPRDVGIGLGRPT